MPGLKQSLADGFPVNYYWEESTGTPHEAEDVVSPLNAAWLFFVENGGTSLGKLLSDSGEHETKEKSIPS